MRACIRTSHRQAYSGTVPTDAPLAVTLPAFKSALTVWMEGCDYRRIGFQGFVLVVLNLFLTLPLNEQIFNVGFKNYSAKNQANYLLLDSAHKLTVQSLPRQLSRVDRSKLSQILTF